MTKPFDLVVHGATGFTGRLVVEYLLQRYPAGSGLRWAMGGRNADKLAAVRDEVGAPADTPLVVPDTSNPASLQALMDSTRLVLTTVGPYQLYGNELVAACAKAGVDYVDLCGEPAWMRQMIDAHEAAAKASGARIVFSCGFDSIPFDLGVFLLQKEFAQRCAPPAPRGRGRVRKMKGTFSGGTAASLKATMAAAATNPAVLDLLKNPFSLTPGFEGPRQLPVAARLWHRLCLRRNAHHRPWRKGRDHRQRGGGRQVAGLGQRPQARRRPFARGTRKRVLRRAVPGHRRCGQQFARGREGRPRPRLWLHIQDDLRGGCMPAAGCHRHPRRHLDHGARAG